MFAELNPLLAHRSLTITVAALNEGQIRVNVIPHSRAEDARVNEQITYAHKNEVARIPDAAVKALTTPISLTGTAEEIDSKLTSVLLEFVESHTQLQSSFERASAEIGEAVKAIDERNKAKSKSKAANSKSDSKADAKNNSDSDLAKPADTLPLWWTNSSVSPPGVAAPESGSVVASADESAENKKSEKAQEVPGNVIKSNKA
jgi:PRTRC genetic system protein E